MIALLILMILQFMFYMNTFVFKDRLFHFLLVLAIMLFPLIFFIIKPKTKAYSLIFWGISLVPFLAVSVMILIFGFPPESYSLTDLLRFGK